MKKWGNEGEDERKDSIAIISREDEKIFWLREEGKEGLNINLIGQFISNFINSSLEWIPENEVLPSSKIENNRETSVLNKLNFELFNEEILKKVKSFF
uniref:Uncharacterized protein n=1 Tax=Meloidogyne incognita TaxID=6306 RepID=A0A914NA79_MELIC